MSWCKDGSTVKADYLGQIVVGVVEDSRVKYGGTVQYTVRPDEPVWVESRWADVVLINEKNVLADYGVIL